MDDPLAAHNEDTRCEALQKASASGMSLTFDLLKQLLSSLRPRALGLKEQGSRGAWLQDVLQTLQEAIKREPESGFAAAGNAGEEGGHG